MPCTKRCWVKAGTGSHSNPALITPCFIIYSLSLLHKFHAICLLSYRSVPKSRGASSSRVLLVPARHTWQGPLQGRQGSHFSGTMKSFETGDVILCLETSITPQRQNGGIINVCKLPSHLKPKNLSKILHDKEASPYIHILTTPPAMCTSAPWDPSSSRCLPASPPPA